MHLFQQNWNWSIAVNEQVKQAVSAKTMARRKRIVGDWQDRLRYAGAASKPSYISDEVWTALKAYWYFSTSIHAFNLCSAARLTPDAEGNLPWYHTSGQTTHAG